MKLTDDILANAIRKIKIYKIFDGEGLYVEIPPSGNLRWKFRYRLTGTTKDCRISMGHYPTLSIIEARKMRTEFKDMLQNGIDPLDVKKRNKKINRNDKTIKIRTPFSVKITAETRIVKLENRIEELLEMLMLIKANIRNMLHGLSKEAVL